MMMSISPTRSGKRRWSAGSLTDRLFMLAVVIKGVDGLFEMVGAFLLSVVRPSTLNAVVAVMTEHELFGTRGDILFRALRVWFAGLTPDTLRFAAAYLFVHGAMKALLAVGLLAGRPWAYPVGSAFLAIFLAYTLYRMSLGWSWVLFGFAMIDAVTLLLVLREWTAERSGAHASHRALPPPEPQPCMRGCRSTEDRGPI